MKLNKILKYLVYSIITVLLLEYIPQKKLPDSDIIFIITTLILSSIILDIISDKNYFEYFKKNINENFIPNNTENYSYQEIITDQSNEIELDDTESNEIQLDDTESNEIESDDTESNENESNSKIIESLKSKLLSNEIDLLEKNCIDEKKCLNIIDQLLLNNKINEKEKILLKINYGIKYFKNLKSFYQQDRLNDDILIEISNMIDTKSNILVDELLNYYINNNLISNLDKTNIMNNLDLNQDHTLGRSYLINLFTKINNNDISKIDIACSSDSIDKCSILLNKLKNKNQITEKIYNEILKLYNKPGFIDVSLENNTFAKLDNNKIITNTKEIVKNNDKNKNVNVKIKKSNKFDKESDINYSIYKNITPLGENNETFNNKFINGNDYLNTDKWKIPVYEPPLCKLDQCNECNDDIDYPLNVSHWDKSRKILQRDNINIDYINDNLNS